MLVLDFETIKGMNIPEKEVYDWCDEAWRMKDRCVLPVKSKMWEGGGRTVYYNAVCYTRI